MQDDDDVVRPLRPRRAQRPQARGGRLWRWRGRIIVLVLPLLLIIGSLLRFYVDLLWFDEVGQRDVLVTRYGWSAAMGLGFGLLTFAVLFANFTVARRVARNDLYVPFLNAGADPDAPEQPVVPHFVLKPVLLGVAALVAVISGLVMSSRWEVVLRFLGRSDFGVDDPHFHRDASFYVFTMPLLELVTHALQALLVVTALGVVAAYVATGVIRYTPVPRVARTAVVHLSWLVAAFLVVSAAQYRLSMWDLATSARGYVAGAGWTDVHARIPGYWLMLVASLVLAVVIVLYARRERWRVVGGSVVGWFVASIIVTGVVPALVQNVLVEPNELDREHKVITGNIANTRAAFGLGVITTTPFKDEASLDRAALLTDNAATTDNLRLWSPFVLRDVVHQEQALRRYYTFNRPDVDRYTIDGDYRQVMVSVRELDPGNNAISNGWTNERLAYTHGYGAVATLPNEVTRQGKPEYLLRNLPPKTTQAGTGLDLKRPEVYFGENGNDFVIVGSKQGEISGSSQEDAGKDDTSARSHYTGAGGIRMSGFGRRIAFASTFRDPRILFSGQFTSKSRLMFRRTVTERVHELAPFLEIDGDPYAVIEKGRIKWIVDAYTTSDRFPYSNAVNVGTTAQGGGRDVNYMRNSVKAVIDAYDGDITLYAMDEKDPILGAWRDIFPKLFTDKSKLPEELRAHLRYPEDLFEVQTRQWKRYHMSDVADFYQHEDEWEVPSVSGADLKAFYVLAKLPGEAKEELLLIRPMTPLTKKNMVAYMAARSDGSNYGKITTLRLSTQELTQGPSQVQALIKQDTDVSRQVREWTTANNTVIYGDLLVLPIDKSLLYAQPIYLENQEAAIPEFQKIVVALGDTIAWGDTFPSAVESLLAKRADDVGASDPNTDQGSGAEGGTNDTPSGSDTPSDTPSGTDTPAGGNDVPRPAPGDFADLSKDQLAKVLGDVSAAYDRADACQRKGDTVCYAEALEQVERLLAAARETKAKPA
ncbi:MAG: hypothetical protein JWM98_657 [Thermoleophilia bacterium]|nr:hypothetical protein [Thermoleophilia bacterium]